MITQQSLLLPPAKDKLINGDGSAAMEMQTWMRVIQGRTGGTSGVIDQSDDGLTAAGTSQATALLVTNDFNFVTTAPAGSGVVLSDLQAGQQQWVFNRSLAAIKIYPPVGGQIDTLGLNTPYSLPSIKAQVFTCSTVNQIYSLQLG